MVKYMELHGFYNVEKTIGCGGFAKVKLATHVTTGLKVAIKIMDKKLLGDDLPRIKLELEALKSLSHDHICKLLQIIESDEKVFIVMEYCSGGELFDYIIQKNRLSESEGRLFFRQIVSAVAYIHSLGYAHRDLKPENILLHEDQNLKIIDFGLCAKPEGGILNPLITSCGSPTYAAPELVQGRHYLGPEIDVWSLGVLLYALLVGALPFDDMNIENLYRKILCGKYDEPKYLSTTSRRLIRSMLQVDPKQRITVKDLLTHPWLTLGILPPVDFKSNDWKCFKRNCVELMSKNYKISEENMWKRLRQWKFDYDTATYFLLLSRKDSDTSSTLYNMQEMSKQINFTTEKDKNVSKCSTLSTPIPCKKSKRSLDKKYVNSRELLESKQTNDVKSQKRMRNQNTDNDCTVPKKKFAGSKDTTPLKHFERAELSTPESIKSHNESNKVLGSIERSLHKIRHILTPKRRYIATNQPAILTAKELCNVSTTQCTNPEFVINALSKILTDNNIQCVRKGFTLRGKMDSNFHQSRGGCSFELEVCYLPANLIYSNLTLKSVMDTKVGNEEDLNSQTLIAIRRKRLKGDSWSYKRVCEQILTFTSTCSTSIESLV